MPSGARTAGGARPRKAPSAWNEPSRLIGKIEGIAMTDPRNIAHDKKIQQEKKHQHKEDSPGASQKVQPGRKPHMKPQPDSAPTAQPAAPESDEKAEG